MSKPVLVIYDHVRNRVAGVRDHILCTDCNNARWIPRDQSARCPCGYTLIMAILRGVAVERESREVLQFTDYSVIKIPYKVAEGIEDEPKTIEVTWDNTTKTIHGLPTGTLIYCTACGDSAWGDIAQDGKCRCGLYLIGCISKGLAQTVGTAIPIKCTTTTAPSSTYNVWYSHNGRQIMNMPPLPVQCVSCDYTWGQTQWRTDDLASEERCGCNNLLRTTLAVGHLRVSDGQRMRLLPGPPETFTERFREHFFGPYDINDLKTTTNETETNDMNVSVHTVKVKAGILAQLINRDNSEILWEKLVTDYDLANDKTVERDSNGNPIYSLIDYAAKVATKKKNDTIAGLFADDSTNTDNLLPKQPKK